MRDGGRGRDWGWEWDTHAGFKLASSRSLKKTGRRDGARLLRFKQFRRKATEDGGDEMSEVFRDDVGQISRVISRAGREGLKLN